MFETDKAFKFYEEDTYENGCIPDSGGTCIYHIKFSDNTLNGLIKQMENWFDTKREDMEFNSCDNIGRVDIGVMEDDKGDFATKAQLELFKQGKCRLWYAIYTFNVSEVTRELVDFDKKEV